MLQANGQKEQKVLEMVLKTAPSGDPQAVIDVIDNYAWNTGFLMNIGDRKGAVMEAALHRCQPKVCCTFQPNATTFPSSLQQMTGLTGGKFTWCYCHIRLLVASAFACVPTPEHKLVKSCTIVAGCS